MLWSAVFKFCGSQNRKIKNGSKITCPSKTQTLMATKKNPQIDKQLLDSKYWQSETRDKIPESNAPWENAISHACDPLIHMLVFYGKKKKCLSQVYTLPEVLSATNLVDGSSAGGCILPTLACKQ